MRPIMQTALLISFGTVRIHRVDPQAVILVNDQLRPHMSEGEQVWGRPSELVRKEVVGLPDDVTSSFDERAGW
jgi:hypothetical protein